MDDLKVADDHMRSVRNTADRIIQFEYGEDKVDPARSRKGEPFDVNQVVDDALRHLLSAAGAAQTCSSVLELIG